MSVRFFEGPAGTGKTTRLMREVDELVESGALEENERLLALSKMHGSRRRLQRRLTTTTRIRRRFQCLTVDSFARRLTRRWRTLARARFGDEPAADDYDEICRRAGELLSDVEIRSWVTRTFPVVLVDEMQDSKEGQLAMIKSLASSAICLTAADDYQDLQGNGSNAAVEWARQNADVEILSDNHRTNASGLRAAASAIRSRKGVPPNGGGFTLLGAPNPNVGAKFVASSITWWWKCNDIAILSPVRPENALFVRRLMNRVAEKPIGKENYGPFTIPWELSHEAELQETIASLNLPAEASATVEASDIASPEAPGIPSSIAMWLDKQRRVAGRTVFTRQEVEDRVRVLHRQSRAYRRSRNRGVRAMTIHQAKNREFDSVIVLWPYEVGGPGERARRLLYNAVTRAKTQAVVIVQDCKRLEQAPFTSEG